MSDIVSDHQQACAAFTTVVGSATDRWSRPSPCEEWDARGVLEHVIGFHDALLLQPMGMKPTRPKSDPDARWEVTVDALFEALNQPDALTPEREQLVGVLTTDVLVHTWDLAKAIGVDVDLDPRLSQIGLDRAVANLDKLQGSGMFAPPVPVAADAPVADRLLGVFGRDPEWVAPE